MRRLMHPSRSRLGRIAIRHRSSFVSCCSRAAHRDGCLIQVEPGGSMSSGGRRERTVRDSVSETKVVERACTSKGRWNRQTLRSAAIQSQTKSHRKSVVVDRKAQAENLMIPLFHKSGVTPPVPRPVGSLIKRHELHFRWIWYRNRQPTSCRRP